MKVVETKSSKERHLGSQKNSEIFLGVDFLCFGDFPCTTDFPGTGVWLFSGADILRTWNPMDHSGDLSPHL